MKLIKGLMKSNKNHCILVEKFAIAIILAF